MSIIVIDCDLKWHDFGGLMAHAVYWWFPKSVLKNVKILFWKSIRWKILFFCVALFLKSYWWSVRNDKNKKMHGRTKKKLNSNNSGMKSA